MRSSNLSLIAMGAMLLGVAAQPTEMRLMRFPTVHGDTVVFTYASDLWVASKDGGTARRLTSHPGDETRARISPDGTMVAFSASYDGNPDVYVMPIEGGEPVRLTFDPENDNVIGWRPDGKIAYVSTGGNFTTRQTRLWCVDPRGGLPIRTPLAEVADGSYTQDCKRLYFNRVNSHARNWRRYRGGSQGRISMYEFDSNKYAELPSKGENSWFPMVVGDDVYYASDRNLGTVNLYCYDTKTKQDKQITKYADADIKWPSTDGKSIVFERDGYLYAYDIKTGDTSRIVPTIKSDFLATRPMVRKLGDQITDGAISPSGVRVAVIARGEAFSVPAKSGQTINLSHTSGARERSIDWSPDGATIAFLCDKSGEWQVHTVPSDGGPDKQVSSHNGANISNLQWSPDSKSITFTTDANELWTLDPATKSQKRVFKGQYGSATDYSWSPDSKWIAYVDRLPTGFGVIYLYDVANGKSTKVTDGRYNDYNVSFDLSGKYLYFLSPRTFRTSGGEFELSLKITDATRVYLMSLAKDTPNPLFPTDDREGAAPDPKGEGKPDVKIDFDGLADRVIPLPMPAKDQFFTLGANEGIFTYDNEEQALKKFDLKSKENQTILTGVPLSLSFNPSRTKVAYFAGSTLGIVDAKPGGSAGQGKVNTSGVEALVDPRAEWKQMFWDSWRMERDNFYDEKMLNLDWKAIGQRYEKYLPYVTHRSDLSYVLGLLIGELGTSHSYVQTPGTPEVAALPKVAVLGADYELAGDRIRISRIYPGRQFEEGSRGPLAEPGVNVHEGDYLLEIDGEPVTALTHPNSLLVNKAGRLITITVNDKPSLEGARRVKVRPTSDESTLRYVAWVEERKRMVDEMSGGRIAYIHYPSTGPDGHTEFIRGYWAQTDKDAVILDDRWNSGGNIQPFVVPTLGRSYFANIQQRNLADARDMDAINGPKVMLINGYAGSGGDFTPWMFWKAKMGTLVGTRTAGALVGINGYYQLMDGGGVSAPEFAFYDPDTGEWVAENTGVAPDVQVDARPDLIAQGKDPQLEKAVEILLAELKNHPRKVKKPDFRRMNPGH